MNAPWETMLVSDSRQTHRKKRGFVRDEARREGKSHVGISADVSRVCHRPVTHVWLRGGRFQIFRSELVFNALEMTKRRRTALSKNRTLIPQKEHTECIFGRCRQTDGAARLNGEDASCADNALAESFLTLTGRAP